MSGVLHEWISDEIDREEREAAAKAARADVPQESPTCGEIHPELAVGEWCRRCGWAWTAEGEASTIPHLAGFVARLSGPGRKRLLDALRGQMCLACGCDEVTPRGWLCGCALDGPVQDE